MTTVAEAVADDGAAAKIYRTIQRIARDQNAEAAETGSPPVTTQELLVRHALESFLERLARTPHGEDFVLKGGILLAAYGIRRPTKDVDAEAIATDLTPANLKRIVTDIAGVDADDGVTFDLDTLTVEEIREDAEYTGLRLRVTTYISTARVGVAWDVSAGDPIIPQAQLIEVPRIIGEPVEILGYAPETVVAEKGVTILQRGITSTRWRDYVDIVQLDRQYDLDPDLLKQAVAAVATYREVQVTTAAPLVEGYGDLAQPKWSAWRQKAGVAALSEEDLDEQMRLVCAVIDPVFSALESGTPEASGRSH